MAMKEIPLTQGFVALVDDDDYERLNRFNWCIDGCRRYAVRNGGPPNYRLVYMHREIIRIARGKKADHRNGNFLDNRKENLREATQSQNLQNTRIRSDNTSGCKGVTWAEREQRWRATIHVKGKQLGLGYFRMKEQASEAYRKAATQHFGEFARV